MTCWARACAYPRMTWPSLFKWCLLDIEPLARWWGGGGGGVVEGFLTSPVDADIAIVLGLKLRDDCGE